MCAALNSLIRQTLFVYIHTHMYVYVYMYIYICVCAIRDSSIHPLSLCLLYASVRMCLYIYMCGAETQKLSGYIGVTKLSGYRTQRITNSADIQKWKLNESLAVETIVSLISSICGLHL